MKQSTLFRNADKFNKLYIKRNHRLLKFSLTFLAIKPAGPGNFLSYSNFGTFEIKGESLVTINLCLLNPGEEDPIEITSSYNFHTNYFSKLQVHELKPEV